MSGGIIGYPLPKRKKSKGKRTTEDDFIREFKAQDITKKKKKRRKKTKVASNSY